MGVYNNPPKVYRKDSGGPEGIFIDIIEYVAEKEGWKMEYVFDNWDSALLKLEKNEIDLMPDMAMSGERKKRFDFNRLTVLSSWIQFYGRSGTTINSFTELKGKTIAVLKGSIQQRVCDETFRSLGIELKLMEVPDYREAIAAVESGQADTVTLSRFYSYNLKTSGLSPYPLQLHPTTLHFATAKGKNAELLDAIDRHLAEILNDGNSVYYRSLARWLNEKPRFLIPRILLWTIAAATAGLLLFAALSLLLRRRVRMRTLELEESNKEIRRSLADKEVLLQELYHRTKNNMSVICSLLSLRARITTEKAVSEFSKEMESKIVSMALVHKMLYESSNLSGFELKKYVEQLVEKCLDFFPETKKRLYIKMSIDPINISFDTAIPFSLVLNELMTNALKHAFPDGMEGEINIDIIKLENDRAIFSFSDNGRGVADGFSPGELKTQGIQLIFDLVRKQMEGTIRIEKNQGMKYVIEFPLVLHARRV